MPVGKTFTLFPPALLAEPVTCPLSCPLPALHQVVRCTLENSVSVAKTFLLADVVVVEQQEPKRATAAAAGPSDYDY